MAEECVCSEKARGLGRGVYYMLRHKQSFDVQTFFK